MSAFCGRMSATALWFAGPRHDMRVSSQMLHITRFVLTETPDPELEPRPDVRAPDLAALVALDAGEFARRYGDTPFERPGLEGMRRNARAVVANGGAPHAGAGD